MNRELCSEPGKIGNGFISGDCYPHPLALLASERGTLQSMKEFYAEINDHLQEYENRTITISEDIQFSIVPNGGQITL